MEFRKLLFASAAVVVLCSIGYASAEDAQAEQTRQLNQQQLEMARPAHSQLNTIRPWPSNDLAQIGEDGLPAGSEEIAQRNEQPRDMSPQTDFGDRRSAQTEKPGDQRMTTPLPPTTGTETKAVTLSQIERPEQTLKNVPVESKDGRKIGEVAQVTLGADGKAQEVVLDDGYGTRLAAAELVYDVERGVLITQLSPFDLAPQSTTPPRE